MVSVWHAKEKKGRGDALSDIRGGGAVKTGSVGQWVTGLGNTTDSAELSFQSNTLIHEGGKRSKDLKDTIWLPLKW